MIQTAVHFLHKQLSSSDESKFLGWVETKSGKSLLNGSKMLTTTKQKKKTDVKKENRNSSQTQP